MSSITLPNGQEYNPSVAQSLKGKAKGLVSDSIRNSVVGTSSFISNVIGEAISPTLGDFLGGVIAASSERKKSEKKETAPKRGIADYLTILKSEVKEIFKKEEIKQEAKQSKESFKKEPLEQKKESIDRKADPTPVNDEGPILKRVANATEMTETASVEQVPLLEKIAGSLELVEKYYKGQEERDFEANVQKSILPKVEMQEQPKSKGIFESVVGVISNFKSIGNVVDVLKSSISSIVPVISAVGSSLASLGPAIGVASAAFAGFKVGSWLNENLINPLTEKATGEKGATLGTVAYDAIDKVKGLFGQSDKDLEKKKEASFIKNRIDLARTNNEPVSQFIEQKAKEYGIPTDGLIVKTNNNVQNVVQNSANRVHEVQNSVQKNLSSNVVNSSKELSNEKSSDSKQPIVVSVPKQDSGSSSSSFEVFANSVNNEPAIRRLNDRLLSTMLV